MDKFCKHKGDDLFFFSIKNKVRDKVSKSGTYGNPTSLYTITLVIPPVACQPLVPILLEISTFLIAVTL